MTKIGFQVSSLKPHLTTPKDVVHSFRKLHDIGYRVLQMQWISFDVPDEFVAEALQETHLTCISVQDKYAAVKENFERFIRQNEMWNSKYMCISGIPNENLSMDGLKQYSAELCRIADIYRERGIILTFHPVGSDYSLVEGIPAVIRLLDSLPDDIQLTLDIYHAVKSGIDPVVLLERYKGRIDMVHFKDSALAPDGDENLTPIGQGRINWPPIFAACRKTGVKWGFAEQETWQKDAFICAEESYKYITSHGIG